MRPPDRTPTYLSFRYRMALVGRFAGFACLGFFLFGAGLLAALTRRLGVSYAQDLTTLSALQEHLPSLLLAAGAVYLPAVVAVGLFLSLCWTHAVSGPLVRVQRYLQALASDENVEDLRFRRTDQLHRLAEAFQRLIDARRLRRAEWAEDLERAEHLIQQCEQWSAQHPNDPSGLREPLRALHRVYEQMHTHLSSGTDGSHR